MSQVTHYKCDICGAEDTDKDKLGLKIVAVGIKTDRYSSYGSNYSELYDPEYRQKEVCLICLGKLGFSLRKVIPGDPKPIYPTLEELVRLIVKEEIGGQ